VLFLDGVPNRKIQSKKASEAEKKKASESLEPNKHNVERYQKLRTYLNDTDTMELDETEAELDFFRSTPMSTGLSALTITGSSIQWSIIFKFDCRCMCGK
jgi:hypothetical protein